MKVDVIQTSFASGEIAPALYGRTDLAQYANAVQLAQNFIPRPYGSIISAPGSKYVATVSDSTLKTRVIPFVFNKTDAYIIETGDVYMRFFTDRAQVVLPTGTEDLSGLSANLVAHYKLNDNTNSTVVLDDTGSHTGTASTNTSTIHATGKVGTGCFNFAGLYDVEVPDSATLSFSETAGNNPFSIVAWVYVTNSGQQHQGIVSKWNGGASGSEYYLSLLSGTQIQFLINDAASSKYAFIQSSSELAVGWHFVVVSYDGRGGSTAADGMNLYIDTVVDNATQTTQSGYNAMVADSIVVKLGSLNFSGMKFANKIDEIAIFNKALSSTEVTSLYNSSVYQITTVFNANEIFDIQFTQLNDVVYLASQNHPSQQLIRTSANEWTIEDFPFIGGPFLDSNTNTATTITASATVGTVNLTVSPTNSTVFTVSSSTLGHHNAYFMIGGLSQTSATTGLQEMGYVKITHVINSYTATATVIKNLKVSTPTSNWAEGAWSAVRGYPASVVFHGSRLYFARTSHEPQKVWGSKIFKYEDFALDTEADDDGLNLQLASNESNEIQWLASGRSLIAGTFGGAFVISSGGDNVVITPTNVQAKEEVGIGTVDIVPKRIGNFLFFLQRFKKKLREMFYFWDLDSYKALDRTILAPHILGDGVVDIGVQIDPEPMLSCVLTNGTLAILTREVDQEVAAWCRRTTTGTYTSIAIIPSQASDYDEAWVVCDRWINGSQKKYIEYFENIKVPDRQDQCVYLDSALTYDAYENTSQSATTISLSASSGSVTLTSNTAYFVGVHTNKRLRAIDEDGNTLGEGTITATASTTSITLSITTTFSALSYTAGRWGISVVSISGLNHLETETVGILADGKTESLTRTVASSTVTLGSNYFVVHAGLSYDQILFTLPKEAGTLRGTAQGKFQRFNEIFFKVTRSTQDFEYGTDADNLDNVNLSFTPTVTTLYTGVLPPQGGGIAMRGGYKRGAQVYIKNSNPLPIELLSIIGTLDTEEK